MSLTIHIDGHLMDVDDGTSKIAVTLQHFDFLSPGSAKASRTNRISLPLTNNNRQVLEQIHPLAVDSSKPYENHSISIVDGVDIIPVGVCQITGIKDRIFLDVQAAVKGFFDALEGLYLNDIDTTDWDGLWDDDRRHDVRNTTSGLICPVVYTGQFDSGSGYVDLYTHGRANIPFFHYKTIIEQIVALTGYEPNINIGNLDGMYTALLISTRLVFNEEWLAKKEFVATNPNPQVIDNANVSQVLQFTQVSGNEDGFFNVLTGEYVVSNPDTALEYFLGVFRVAFRCSGSVSLSLKQIQLNGSDITATTEFDDDIVRLTSSSVTLKHGDVVKVVLSTFLSSDRTVQDCRFQFKADNTTDTALVQDNDWYIYFNQLLPRIALKDFIKDFMVMFGLVAWEKNGVINFTGIETLLTNGAEAPVSGTLDREDLSNKPNVNYTFSGFGRLNYYKWLIQENELFIDETYGRGSFTLDNDTLPGEVVRHTSLFTASDQISTVKINQAANIEIYDQSGPAFTKAATFGIRLLLKRSDDGVAVRFKAGTSVTDYFIGYFIDRNRTHILDFQYILSENYTAWIRTLNRYRSVEQKYFLTLSEFANMDLITLHHKEGVNYLIERIENYIPGRSAKFKMIRI